MISTTLSRNKNAEVEEELDPDQSEPRQDQEVLVEPGARRIRSESSVEVRRTSSASQLNPDGSVLPGPVATGPPCVTSFCTIAHPPIRTRTEPKLMSRNVLGFFQTLMLEFSFGLSLMFVQQNIWFCLPGSEPEPVLFPPTRDVSAGSSGGGVETFI